MDQQKRIVLVLGATGGIGGEVAVRLSRGGWDVRALHRNPAEATRRSMEQLGTASGIKWVPGDAMCPADVIAAAEGASLIVHAVNPPGYRNWGQLVLPMLESSISAARASGARILLPGTVYNYGPDAFPVITDRSPQNPRTRKGAIRVEMERRLRTAAETGVRSLIVRAGDFYGPRAANNWFSQGLVKPNRPVDVITYPGKPGVGHAWAYLPDLAEAMAQLVEREAELEAFETFHFGGHWDADGTKMVEAIRRAVGNPKLRVSKFPWALVVAACPFVTLFREMLEMRYLWREPLRLDNRRLFSLLGAEPHTPIDVAVHTTLTGLGCLNGPEATPSSSGLAENNAP